MWIRICLLALLLLGISGADERSDYDRLKLDITEHKRELNQLHSKRDYKQAMLLQEKIAGLASQALELGLKSTDVKNRGVWIHYADVMKDLGRPEEALKAIDSYMKTPLLDRNGQRNGWRKRFEIYRKNEDYAKAEQALERALSLADKASDGFAYRRDMANLKLKMGRPQEALQQAEAMKAQIADMESAQRLRSESQYRATLVRIYEETGDSQRAEEARRRELQLKVELAERALDDFEVSFPSGQTTGQNF